MIKRIFVTAAMTFVFVSTHAQAQHLPMATTGMEGLNIQNEMQFNPTFEPQNRLNCELAASLFIQGEPDWEGAEDLVARGAQPDGTCVSEAQVTYNGAAPVKIEKKTFFNLLQFGIRYVLEAPTTEDGYKRIEVISFMIKNKANVNGLIDDKRTPLSWAVQTLLNAGNAFALGYEAQYAIPDVAEKLIRTLIRGGAKPKIKSVIDESTGDAIMKAKMKILGVKSLEVDILQQIKIFGESCEIPEILIKYLQVVNRFASA